MDMGAWPTMKWVLTVSVLPCMCVFSTILLWISGTTSHLTESFSWIVLQLLYFSSTVITMNDPQRTACLAKGYINDKDKILRLASSFARQ